MKYEILSKLVSINTINDKENYKFISYVKEYLEKLNFKVTTIDSDNNKCLIAKSKDKCNLCFMGHSDTVNISGKWDTDPFKLEIINNNMYGLGVCDMKGGIACFLDSLNKIDINKLKQGIMIIITYDEEIGFKGINVIKEYKNELPDNIVIGEPTNLEPVISCKGCMEFKVNFIGKSVHSSNLTSGVNAIEIANKFLNKLTLFSKKIKKEINNNFSIPYTTMNIAKINGGSAINIVPNYCELEFDFRTIDSTQHKKILKFISKISKEFNCNYECYTNVYPSIMNNNSTIDYYEKLTNKKAVAYNYVTEGNFLSKSNLIILGPGPVTAHEINEHISLESYEKTAKIYIDIINKYCK